MHTITMQISDNETQRIFFFNQRKNKQMLGGLWEEVRRVFFALCQCRSLGEYVGVVHKPEWQGVESLFETEQNNAIIPLLK